MPKNIYLIDVYDRELERLVATISLVQMSMNLRDPYIHWVGDGKGVIISARGTVRRKIKN